MGNQRSKNKVTINPCVPEAESKLIKSVTCNHASLIPSSGQAKPLQQIPGPAKPLEKSSGQAKPLEKSCGSIKIEDEDVRMRNEEDEEKKVVHKIMNDPWLSLLDDVKTHVEEKLKQKCCEIYGDKINTSEASKDKIDIDKSIKWFTGQRHVDYEFKSTGNDLIDGHARFLSFLKMVFTSQSKFLIKVCGVSMHIYYIVSNGRRMLFYTSNGRYIVLEYSLMDGNFIWMDGVIDCVDTDILLDDEYKFFDGDLINNGTNNHEKIFMPLRGSIVKIDALNKIWNIFANDDVIISSYGTEIESIEYLVHKKFLDAFNNCIGVLNGSLSDFVGPICYCFVKSSSTTRGSIRENPLSESANPSEHSSGTRGSISERKMKNINDRKSVTGPHEITSRIIFSDNSDEMVKALQYEFIEPMCIKKSSMSTVSLDQGLAGQLNMAAEQNFNLGYLKFYIDVIAYHWHGVELDITLRILNDVKSPIISPSSSTATSVSNTLSVTKSDNNISKLIIPSVDGITTSIQKSDGVATSSKTIDYNSLPSNGSDSDTNFYTMKLLHHSSELVNSRDIKDEDKKHICQDKINGKVNNDDKFKDDKSKDDRSSNVSLGEVKVINIDVKKNTRKRSNSDEEKNNKKRKLESDMSKYAIIVNVYGRPMTRSSYRKTYDGPMTRSMRRKGVQKKYK